MIQADRSEENPILTPVSSHAWESMATFNGSVARDDDTGTAHMVYRAVSSPIEVPGHGTLEISTIGHASSDDGVHFLKREQLIVPEHDWERFGCEDPRITKMGDMYFIFYTALSTYPFSAEGIKVALAMTKDFKRIEKRPITPFNAKAMGLFSKRVRGQYAAILTANTDSPPARIAIAYFDRVEDMWSREYWDEWYRRVGDHELFLQRGSRDHVEVGAAPVLTDEGWILVYSEIKNYATPNPIFTIQAVLLDRDDPTTIIGRTEESLLEPLESYERYGMVPNIVFPSGAEIVGDDFRIYYGGADTVVAFADIPIYDLLGEMKDVKSHIAKARRFEGNPIITPNPDHEWEARATFNPGALMVDKKVHIFYRAMSQDNTSVIGHAVSNDGLRISERVSEPMYVPRADFEQKLVPGGNSGCEDPRLTLIDDTIYMCYTAFDGKNLPRAALTSISLKDFKSREWEKWSMPVPMTRPGESNKDVAIFPRKINGKYVIIHRPRDEDVWIDFFDDLEFGEGVWLEGRELFGTRTIGWDTLKVGLNTTPIETDLGWLVIYHGVSRDSHKYRIGAVLLDLQNPYRVIARSHDPLLEPREPYEREGQISNVVFPCGSVVIDGMIHMYYGGADSVVGVASFRLDELLRSLNALKEA